MIFLLQNDVNYIRPPEDHNTNNWWIFWCEPV